MRLWTASKWQTSHPVIHLINMCLCDFLYSIESTPLSKPAWDELIEVKQWRGFGQRSIADSIALHSPIECDNFATLLLKDRLSVKWTRRKYPLNEIFVVAVLEKWYSSVGGPALPCTWKDLTECMKNAGLDGKMIKTIEDNILNQA